MLAVLPRCWSLGVPCCIVCCRMRWTSWLWACSTTLRDLLPKASVKRLQRGRKPREHLFVPCPVIACRSLANDCICLRRFASYLPRSHSASIHLAQVTKGEMITAFDSPFWSHIKDIMSNVVKWCKSHHAPPNMSRLQILEILESSNIMPCAWSVRL